MAHQRLIEDVGRHGRQHRAERVKDQDKKPYKRQEWLESKKWIHRESLHLYKEGNKRLKRAILEVTDDQSLQEGRGARRSAVRGRRDVYTPSGGEKLPQERDAITDSKMCGRRAVLRARYNIRCGQSMILKREIAFGWINREDGSPYNGERGFPHGILPITPTSMISGNDIGRDMSRYGKDGELCARDSNGKRYGKVKR